MPKASILIPCYNAERWVAEAIQSALDQTHPDIEVIVVDDGSTDGSLEIIQSFGDKIRWETGPNRGGNVTRNRLLELSTGEWLQYLDADDYLLTNKIHEQLSRINHDDSAIDVMYSPVTVEVCSVDRVQDRSVSWVDPHTSIYEQWIRWQVAQTGSVLWRRESLLSMGGWNEDYPCCQDNEITLRAIQKGLNFHYCPDAGAVYRIWSEETVCRKDPGRVIQYKTQLLEQMMDWLLGQNKVTRKIESAAGQAFFEMARTLAKFDLSRAKTYRQERIAKGWFHPDGPAAPWHYRLTYLLGGFSFAEKLAAWQRG